VGEAPLLSAGPERSIANALASRHAQATEFGDTITAPGSRVAL